MERANLTLRESLECEWLENLLEARKVINQHVNRNNDERLHSAIGYLPPWNYYCSDPAKRHEERRVKLQQARHARRERNLNLHQPTLPLETPESLTWFQPSFVPLPLKRNTINISFKKPYARMITTLILSIGIVGLFHITIFCFLDFHLSSDWWATVTTGDNFTSKVDLMDTINFLTQQSLHTIPHRSLDCETKRCDRIPAARTAKAGWKDGEADWQDAEGAWSGCIIDKVVSVGIDHYQVWALCGHPVIFCQTSQHIILTEIQSPRAAGSSKEKQILKKTPKPPLIDLLPTKWLPNSKRHNRHLQFFTITTSYYTAWIWKPISFHFRGQCSLYHHWSPIHLL